MQKKISWKNAEVVKVARRVLELDPTIAEKVRDQVKNNTNSRIHGLYGLLNTAQDILPVHRQKAQVRDLATVNRIKVEIASIRSTDQKNYYQPKALRKSTNRIAASRAKKAAPKIAAPKVSAPAATNIVDKLKTIETQLVQMGLTRENRSKILNQVASLH